jgi:hypothetical protein
MVVVIRLRVWFGEGEIIHKQKETQSRVMLRRVRVMVKKESAVTRRAQYSRQVKTREEKTSQDKTRQDKAR